MTPNALQNETSTYLLQHARNPVNWYPWYDAALARAQAEEKPIFLSIGYSACHWCHVMERESFNDPAVAEILNEYFISIKVDREERPDIDSIYMDAVVRLTGQGGWPLSVFLTPSLEPFFGGSYFPPEPKHPLPGFKELLLHIASVWQERRTEIYYAAKSVTQEIKDHFSWETNIDHSPFSINNLHRAADLIISSYDWKNGGWGSAPKFPMPMVIEFLILQSFRGNLRAKEVVDHLLKNMAQGGMYDIVGGGFHRYSMDSSWRIPHFEKMLYDNTQLSLVYLHGFLLIKNPKYRSICEKILDFLVSEMQILPGGFSSSIDADSPGGEGHYYLYDLEEVRSTLSMDELVEFNQTFDHSHLNNIQGQYILREYSLVQKSQNIIQSSNELDDHSRLYNQIIGKLHILRGKRARPNLDQKIITSWNAMAIQAFSEAGRYLNRPEYINTAETIAEFCLDSLTSEKGLFHSMTGGVVKQEAFLEDYASLILGLYSLHQSNQEVYWLNKAVELTEIMVSLFSDKSGGFFTVQSGLNNIFINPKEFQDQATPSGNALAADVLIKMSSIMDRSDWKKMAVELIGRFVDNIIANPFAYGYWLQIYDLALGPISQIALLWPEGDTTYKKFLPLIWKDYRPRTLLAASKIGNDATEISLLSNRTLIDTKPTVYICEDFICKMPISSLDDLSLLLNNLSVNQD